MQNAYGYVRVSSRSQAADDRDGIPRQQESIRKWARANGVHIKKWFIDSVSGGKDLEHRPQLRELIAALHSNGVRTVAIEKLDRLARDLMVQESILADFGRSGFTLISVAEPDLCSTEPTRKLLRQMMGAFAEYERDMIVLKLRGARQRARAKDPSRREGRKRFGVRPGERVTVARIVELRKAGKTLQQIGDLLAAEKRASRTGGPWYPQQVARVLSREGVK
jgi:DNA invertase Pin-like site-specific DNA recombinase